MKIFKSALAILSCFYIMQMNSCLETEKYKCNYNKEKEEYSIIDNKNKVVKNCDQGLICLEFETERSTNCFYGGDIYNICKDSGGEMYRENKYLYRCVNKIDEVGLRYCIGPEIWDSKRGFVTDCHDYGKELGCVDGRCKKVKDIKK